jgi:hypothetical protein
LWRDALEGSHKQPPGFSVGLALGLKLFPKRGDKLAGTVVSTVVGSLWVGCGVDV